MNASESRSGNPRAVALHVLDAVLRHRRPLDEALARDRGLPGLSSRDRAFARLLAATVLRRLGQLDAVIDARLERPLKAKLAAVRLLLRLGAAQLLFLGTPAHAAVSTTVGLARGPRAEAYRGLINAVLRRLAADGPAMIAAQDEVRLTTPGWLWQSWIDAYGEATARRIASAHLADPPIDLTLKDPAAREAWAQRLNARVLPTGSLRLPRGSGDIVDLPGYAEGAWWVQDAAAALPARLFPHLDGREAIDLCAAPGGKAAQLAAMGARVTAVDQAAGRLERLRGNLDRLGLEARLVEADAGQWHPARPAQAVLLDAPCTATGTLRRHPDIAHLKSPEDVAALALKQARLLAAACAMVAPGGTLIYATCSLQPEEGPAQIDALLADGAPFKRVPVTAAEIGGLAEAITPAGDVRTLPCHLADIGGLDGFYIARLRRV